MKIAFIGNCQPPALKRILNFPATIQSTYLSCVHNPLEMAPYLAALAEQDIIVTQPIPNEWQHFSTDFLLKNCPRTAQIIIFPSVRLDFYYPDMIYKKVNGKLLQEPSDYHYKQILSGFVEGETVEQIIQNRIENTDLISPEFLNNQLERSIQELEKRHAESLEWKKVFPHLDSISIVPFVRDRAKKELLFYSTNHPTQVLLQYLAREIQKILGLSNPIDEKVDPLGRVKGILFSALQAVVDFDIEKIAPQIGEVTGKTGVVRLYFEAYKKLGLTKSWL